MGYVEEFITKIVDNSVSKDYGKAIEEWLYRGETYKENGFCICSHPIKENMIVRNRLNKVSLVVGNCCIRKFGIEREHYNKSPKAYLEFAASMVRTTEQEKFILSLQEKLEKWGSLRLTVKQYEWLIMITGKPYRWKFTYY